MADRPILFSGPMVRALLADTKTQTRRVVKWRGVEPGLNLQFSGLSVERSGSNFVLTSATRTSHEYRSIPQPCPYGQPGDRLWVRETWCQEYPGGPLHYRASWPDDALYPEPIWKPSIHMPRWASRITLEITGVRVERLQDISEADAQAEGCIDVDYATGRTYRAAYRDLWEQINGHDSWDANHWVWVVAFKVISPSPNT